MRTLGLLACAALASCSSLQSIPLDESSVQGYSRQLSFLAGARSFDDSRVWDPVDNHATLGIEFNRTRNRDGLGFEIGFLGSFDKEDGGQGDRNVIGVGAELYGGARMGFALGKFSPYVGAGATFLYADVNNDSGGRVSDGQDASVGLYLHGGTTYPITEHTSLGVDLRYVGATDLEFDMVSGDADYLQALFVIAMTL